MCHLNNFLCYTRWMKKILTTDKIYVSSSPIAKRERGVFALKNIKKGELIENCPIIEFSETRSSGVNESELICFIYFLGKDKNKLTIVLGFGSIYNHSYSPNAKYKYFPKEQRIEFIAKENIKKDEEIFVNYLQENPETKNPLWFEVK